MTERAPGDFGAEAVVLHQAVRQRAVLPLPVAGVDAAVGLVFERHLHRRLPDDVVAEPREPVGSVTGAASFEILVEAVEVVENRRPKGDVAAVEVRDVALADASPFGFVRGSTAVHPAAGRPRNDGRVDESVGERVGPRRFDREVVAEKGDGVAARGLDAGVPGDVQRPGGEFDEDVDVVAVPHHPGRSVRRRAVDDDHLGGGRVGGQRVQAGRQPVTPVEGWNDYREVHTGG